VKRKEKEVTYVKEVDERRMVEHNSCTRKEKTSDVRMR
jgi:hypothetical protein